MTRDEIKQIALNAWFELQLQEDGTLDLPQHVYDFAYALLAEAEPTRKMAVLTVPHYNS